MTDMQEVILKIYKSFSKLCQQLGLRHFAIGGTAIGAVRHKGFIPWDDDLDVAMPIEDYKLFMEQAPKLLESPYELVAGGSMPHDKNVFARIIDTSTTFVGTRQIPYPEIWRGVWIDIMPMGGVPAPGPKQDRFLRKLKLICALNDKRRLPFSNTTSITGKLLWVASRPLCFLPYYYFSDAWIKAMESHSFDSSEYVGYTWSWNLQWYTSHAKAQRIERPNGKKELFFPQEWFASTCDVDFETTSICCPKEVHKYLALQFGDDYMSIPSHDKQLIHEGFLDLLRPFSYYQEDPSRLTAALKAQQEAVNNE